MVTLSPTRNVASSSYHRWTCHERETDLERQLGATRSRLLRLRPERSIGLPGIDRLLTVQQAIESGLSSAHGLRGHRDHRPRHYRH